jgi:outer membrane protein assembly factor BamB
MLVLSGIVGLVIITEPVAANGLQEDAPWPMYRGNLNHTGQSPYDTSSNPGELKWRFETYGQVISSPSIGNDGTIYVGSYDYKLYAINPDGTEKWSFPTSHDISLSPAIASDGTIYVGSNYDNRFWAINANGTEKWRFIREGVSRPGFSSSPAIGSDGTIYVGSNDYNMYAINPNGTEKWKFPTNYYIKSSPAIDINGTIYIGSRDDNLYAINPNGTLKWKFITGYEVASSPAIGSDGTIYVGSRDDRLYAINPNGSEKWNFTTGWYVTSSPAINSDGTIYIGSHDDQLYEINPDGTENWNFTTLGDVGSSSPAIGSDGTIFVGCSAKVLYAINPDGSEKWNYWTGGNIDSSPAIGFDGTIYVGSWDGHLYAIGTPPQNHTPVSYAGPDIVTNIGQNVYLDGSGSYDPDGDTLSYNWDFGDGTSSGWQSDSSVYHIYNIPGNYSVNLTVSDGVHSDIDTCIVYVNPQNQQPNADAGLDQAVDQYITVEFNGSSSTDDADIVNYSWMFTYNNVLQELYGKNPQFTFDNPGTYPISLLVKDISGLSDTDTMTVTVLDVEPPLAIAGTDQVIGQYSTVTFNGMESKDNVGIVNYTWNLTYAGNEVKLHGPVTQFKYEIIGEYLVTLEVIDSNGLLDIDSVKVAVIDTEPPVAVAYSENNIEINETLYFDGSASYDNNGIIENYTWTLTYNSDVISLYGPTTNFKFEKPGLYEVTLTVWDPSNNYANDTLMILVTFTDIGEDEPDEEEQFVIPWWIFLILVVIIVILAILLYNNKERRKESEEIPLLESMEEESSQKAEHDGKQNDE